MSDSAVIIKKLQKFLESENSLQLAILFGSAARNVLRPDSDIDLALQYENELSIEEKQLLCQRLETLLQRPIDLLELQQLSGTILKEVLCNGKILLKRSSKLLFAHMQKMLYHQADMMPYIRRTYLERQQRFQHGKTEEKQFNHETH